jgi:hypothetical protein
VTRSIKIVPTVREIEAPKLPRSRYARYRSPSFAGTMQFTNQDRKRISVAAR